MMEKYNKNNKVNLYITFYSEKKDVTRKYYLQCPKPMIENQMLKILDPNPLLIKLLGAYLELIPLLDRIIYKCCARTDVLNKKKKIVLDHNWCDFEPQQPSKKLSELTRFNRFQKQKEIFHDNHNVEILYIIEIDFKHDNFQISDSKDGPKLLVVFYQVFILVN